MALARPVVWLCFAVGAVLVVLSITVFIGWFGDYELLRRFHQDLPSMKFNTAVGFLLLGLSNLALAARRLRTTRVLAALVALLGGSTLFQYATGRALGIDTLFWKVGDATGGVIGAPGRMASNTALAFVFCAVAIGWSELPRRAFDPVVVACLGAAVMALSAVTVAGYAIGLYRSQSWDVMNAMALHTAGAFLLEGGLLVTLGTLWPDAASPRRQWMMLPAGIALGLCALLFWLALDSTAQGTSRRALDDALGTARAALVHRLGDDVGSLRRMAERWARRGSLPESEWSAQAQSILRDFGDYRAIAVFDTTPVPRWQAPSDVVVRFQGPLPAPEEAQPRLLLVDAPGAHDKELLVLVPLGREGEVQAALVGIIPLQHLFATTLSPASVANHAVQVTEDGALLYTRGMPEGAAHQRGFMEVVLDGRVLRLTLASTSEVEMRQGSALGAIVLVAWAVLAGVVLVAFRLAETGRTRAVELLEQQALVREKSAELERSNVELERSRRELLELASRDDMTGLLNRRELTRLFDEEVARVGRIPRPLSLLLIDIDHFKAINDEHGHAAGDEVIRHIAQLMQRTVRLVDRAARVGGEEFVILLPETDGAAATSVAERFRMLVLGSACSVIDAAGIAHDVQLRVSIGVATAGRPVGSLAELLARADLGLYRAKADGRNRVVAAA